MDDCCGFCGEQKPLRISHILPAFVYRWLRKRSGTGHIRNTDNANRRVQDGLKLPFLCEECEQRFSAFETAFATNLFYPWLAGASNVSYDEWLLKFCTSVSWRVLKFARGQNPLARYSDEQKMLMDRAEAQWRAFLRGDIPHPGEFEQHLVIFDIVESTNVPNLPSNFNRFMTGAVTLDIVGSERSLMTFAKLGRFTIFGMIQMGTRWSGTKVHVRHGHLRPKDISIPSGILSLFTEKAEHARAKMSEISPAQRDKIDRHVRENIDAFAASEQFEAMKADALMFGEGAVLWNDET